MVNYKTDRTSKPCIVWFYKKKSNLYQIKKQAKIIKKKTKQQHKYKGISNIHTVLCGCVNATTKKYPKKKKVKSTVSSSRTLPYWRDVFCVVVFQYCRRSRKIFQFGFLVLIWLFIFNKIIINIVNIKILFNYFKTRKRKQ